MKIKKILAAAALIGFSTIAVSCGSTSDQSSETPQTQSSSEAVSSNSYKVRVLYPDGTPANGLKIQWCTVSGTCFANMSTTDSSGYATTESADILNSTSDLNVHIQGVPTGYTYNPFTLVQNKDNRDGVINLIALNSTDLVAGASFDEATEVSLGYYNTKPKKDGGYVYFKVKFAETGTYEIESYADSEYNTKISLRDSSNKQVASDDDSGNANNFKFVFDIDNETFKTDTYYTFIIQQNANVQTTFTFSILKK